MYNSTRMSDDTRQPRWSRANNFTDLECLELIRAVKKYANIVEYRDDGKKIMTNDDRNRAWDAICREFNMRTGLVERSVSSLKNKWNNDKSNIRDYVQYLETSHSRSGRPPEEIPKPKFMNAIAEIIGSYCPQLGPVPNIDEIVLENPDMLVQTTKVEPPIDVVDLPFEDIMVNSNSDQFHFNVGESSSSLESFHGTTTQNDPFQPPPPKRTRLSQQVPPFQPNGSTHSNDSEIQELQIQLLKRQIEVQNKQIEVQELMAKEIEAKIERTKQLMQMDAAESELRCKEISKRLK